MEEPPSFMFDGNWCLEAPEKMQTRCTVTLMSVTDASCLMPSHIICMMQGVGFVLEWCVRVTIS